MTLAGIELIVHDVAASVAFYRRVGVPIADEAVWSKDGKAHHVDVVLASGLHLQIDSIELTKSYYPTYSAPAKKVGRVLLSFDLPSRDAVDTLYKGLTAGGSKSQLAPMDAFWGARYAIVEDPDGNPVGLMSPPDPDKATEGPSI